MSEISGGFTLPGEAGYEDLTLKLAKKWGADVIRDSDGTELSPEIVNAGYGIYSTICLIRDHNDWAKKHMDKLQQTFLVTQPVMAVTKECSIPLMKDFFREQFRVNDSADASGYWQVYDRTENVLLDRKTWEYDREQEIVLVHGAIPFHHYTVSFLAWRIWEEISMYNHVTNHWEKEHLMPLDPIYPEVQEFLKDWLKNWCENHPDTTVVRFTSMFYNFVWIWGNRERNRNLFTDWASYDFTVSAYALDRFAEQMGHRFCAEDFINKGDFHVTHMPATKEKLEWMDFIHDFVVSFGKELVSIVHAYGKKAYVFYDDSWIGIEPWKASFREFGFDGLIKCVFSGYEARLCSGVDVPVHELRFHPYLFPVGLGGKPTFMEGGNPKRDAEEYWLHVRRGLLRASIQRIGLGGYLHLTENYPDFQDYIEEIADEFRQIKSLHENGMPYTCKTRVAVLHYWGKLRSWTLSGHFHETYMHDLIHINEALAGLPVEVDFINFQDIRNGRLAEYDVVINAGKAGSAWSGGSEWRDSDVVTRLTKWVYEGGSFIGVQDPSAVDGFNHFFRMAEVLGVDKDNGAKVCHGKWEFDTEEIPGLIPEGFTQPERDGVFVTDESTKVILAHDNNVDLSIHTFGEGKGIYLSGFTFSYINARALLNIVVYASGEATNCFTDNPWVECTYYPSSRTAVLTNNAEAEEATSVQIDEAKLDVHLGAHELRIIKTDTL